MDGIDVIRQVRTWSNLPIIVISARSDDGDKIEALDAGADDYLTKPFSVEELLARLRVTLRRLSLMSSETGTDRSVYTHGQLRIDYFAGCAYLGDEELKLTPMEYKILCLLARNTGKVLTHTFITQNIYGRNVKGWYLEELLILFFFPCSILQDQVGGQQSVLLCVCQFHGRCPLLTRSLCGFGAREGP